ncbi:MAG: hypothetical protein HY820_37725 [Acidobacteria bacterium]|nr:hypothetical protein [Acidobacteriota bacterium]
MKLVAFAACVFSAGALAAEDVPLRPYVLDWKDPNPIADASSLLHTPAGKHGFVIIRDGHLATTAGRLRLWGMNITSAANEPSKSDAPLVAAFLARHGINCVRMHFLDNPSPRGLIDSKRPDTREFDAAQLDRLDFFIAALKQRGIYVNLNLNVGRTYKEADGVADPEYIGFAKALTYFDPRLLELQREYARKLLTHRNPYTGAEYRNEPAVALVELVNENSLIESWVQNRLLGKASRPRPGTWTDIPATYEKQLTALYTEWLRKRGQPPVPRLRKEEFASAGEDRFRVEATFYMEIEDRYFQSMSAFLKKDLGVKSLVLGTSDHNHGMSGYALLSSSARLDVVDGHTYWQHPSYIVDPATGKTTGFRIRNTAMVDDPLHSSVVELSRSAVAGKPYIVSEVNHPFPAEHAAEGIPILTAYAAFQDWDGIFWYTFEHAAPDTWRPKQSGHFDFRADPVKMAQVAAGAFTFLRGDVHAARQTVLRGYSREQVLDSLRMTFKERPYFTPGFDLRLPLEHASRISSFDRPREADTEAEDGSIRSDTRQLTWHDKPGAVTVDSDRTHMLIGFLGAHQLATKHLSAKLENKFAALQLTSLDGLPISRSRSMLLTSGARTANTAMQWNPERTSLTNWGTEPTVIEPVTGTVTLTNLPHAKSVRVTAPGLKPVPARRAATGWEIPLGGAVTPWYRIDIE